MTFDRLLSANTLHHEIIDVTPSCLLFDDPNAPSPLLIPRSVPGDAIQHSEFEPTAAELSNVYIVFDCSDAKYLYYCRTSARSAVLLIDFVAADLRENRRVHQLDVITPTDCGIERTDLWAQSAGASGVGSSTNERLT